MGDALTFTPVMNWHPEQTEKYVIDGNLLILRVGKWKVKVVRIVSDEEYEGMGLDAPGWKEWKEGQVVFQDEEEAQKARSEGVTRIGRVERK